ncbi:uncharacterized protein RHO25_005359 [Cercospora beticola]|uniref:Uncharacterized protein n=1 Tax=Cercospora beticola TaxID=122368 RepID=A0ABZ0NMM9_CERBT|nr:hypothetical protein RHO25_005359 [Cercospora beticola]CAK1361027.1 unnamed protein product [Cercospora beticola]
MHICYHACSDHFSINPDGYAYDHLGKKALRNHSSPREYWSQVGTFLRELLTGGIFYIEIGSVILHGEHAMDKDLVKVVQHELQRNQKGKADVPFISIDPVFAGALGAARLGMKCPFHDRGQSSERCIPDLRPKRRQVPWKRVDPSFGIRPTKHPKLDI